LLQEANDLLFAVFAFSHTRHSPNLTDPSEYLLVRYQGSRSEVVCVSCTSSCSRHGECDDRIHIKYPAVVDRRLSFHNLKLLNIMHEKGNFLEFAPQITTIRNSN
jgi:hypothetical protein